MQEFFQNVAWHYDIVHEATFTGQLIQWSCLSYHQLRQAPDGLPTSLRPFPALLLQVLAQALLFQPTNHDKSLDDLTYAAGMELSDRAVDFSDAGHQLASSFRKSELTITIVQAGLMRAVFEKTTGAVIEAWHTLGIAIRDAQELGLHLTDSERTLSSKFDQVSDSELGCRLWLMLHIWDAHMATVLGRPMSTRMDPNGVVSPMSWCRSPSSVPKMPQPRDVILCGYHAAYKFLQDIHELDKKKDCRLLVENMHEQIVTNIANLPVWATRQSPGNGVPPWLSAAVETMHTNMHFVLFALHRPFVLFEQSSRDRAYYSATQMLESQARLFEATEALQYKTFSLVFATLDAMVLIAALQIRFPNEFIEQLPASKKDLAWGLRRLEILQAKNNLASSAFKVIQRLYQRVSATELQIQLPDTSYGLPGDTAFIATEPEMAQAQWDNPAQYDFGLLPDQALNELLSSGMFGSYLENQTGLFLEPPELPFESLNGHENRSQGSL